jgi:hypothetical protein
MLRDADQRQARVRSRERVRLAMAKLAQTRVSRRRRSPAILIGASLLASIGALGLLGRGPSTLRRLALAGPHSVSQQANARPLTVAPAAAQPAPAAPGPEPARPSAAPALAAAPADSDPFYAAAACPSLEVIRAVETQAGSEALAEVAVRGEPHRLRLGDSVEGRMLSFVGPHPKHGRLTVVFEGHGSACSAMPRSSGLALHRADREASLSRAAGTGGEEAQSTSQFALALGETKPNPGDFSPAVEE